MKEFVYKNDIPKKISTSLSKSDKVSNLVREKIGMNNYFKLYSNPNVIYDDLNKNIITHNNYLKYLEIAYLRFHIMTF